MPMLLCKELGFPSKAIQALSQWDERIAAEPSWSKLLQTSIADYASDGQAHLELLETLSREMEAPLYEIHMVFLLHCAKDLRQEYARRGLPDQLFLDTMSDLRYKLLECHRIYGQWGTFVLHWYRGFFRLERFQLGRLQYEIRPWKGVNYEPWLREGENAYWCHIPSSGPCTPEAVLDSLKRAYEFYKIQGVFAVSCKSWMLYPPHFPLFKPGGNLSRFQQFFKVFHQEERENVDLWRIFGVKENVDISRLPEETALQRSFASWLRQGNKMGCGAGILLFDGENVLTYHDNLEVKK